jgi:hypothetical protein
VATHSYSFPAPSAPLLIEERWLRVHIVAKRLGLKARMVRYLIETEVLPARRANLRAWEVRESDVARLKKERAADESLPCRWSDTDRAEVSVFAHRRMPQ